MFGTPAARTPLQSRELTGVILLGIAALAAIVSAFVITRPGGSGDSAAPPVAQAQVMPGMGLVMPENLSVPVTAGQLDVAIGDYWFKPSTVRLRAGEYVLKARSYGVESHDIMIERTPIRFSTPGAPLDAAAPYGLDGVDPGTTRSAKIMLTPGTWELFCSVPGHYRAGQHERITAYGPMPSGMEPPSTSGMGSSPSGMGDSSSASGA